jgi:tetratricopeptide (TPR) repeat protein
MTLFGWLFQGAHTSGLNSPAINKTGPGDVIINYPLLTAQEREEFADTIARKLREHRAVPDLPGGDRAVADAVGNIAAGAGAGDTRLKEALALLAANKPAQAEPLLQEFAEAKTAQIVHDRKDAATAYRNLGSITGLRDPKRAQDAYAQAADLDPDDLYSQFCVGWLAKERGDFALAEGRLRHTLAKATNQEWPLLFWSRLGLADIAAQHGNPQAALDAYRTSLATVERLAAADPNNAQWQRDLSVLHNRIGDMLAAQGNRPAALEAYRAGLAIGKGLPAFSALIVIIKRRPDNRASRPPNGDSNGGSTEAMVFGEEAGSCRRLIRSTAGTSTFGMSFSSCPRANINRTRPVADRGLACFS